MRPHAPIVEVFDYDNAMYVIGHNDPRIQSDFIPNICGMTPFLIDDLACCTEMDGVSGDIPEQAFAVLGANGDKVRSG